MHIGCGVPITAAWVAHWQARAQQIELKKRMGKIVKQREHHWFDVQQKQLAEAKAALNAAKMEAEAAKNETAEAKAETEKEVAKAAKETKAAKSAALEAQKYSSV